MSKEKYILTIQKSLMDKVVRFVEREGSTVSNYVETALKNQLEMEFGSDAIDIDLVVKKRIDSSGFSHPDKGLQYHSKDLSSIEDSFTKRDIKAGDLGDDYIELEIAEPNTLLAHNFNRFFPEKIFLRVLIYLIYKSDNALPALLLDKFGKFSPTDFNHISKIGIPFKNSDIANHRKRGEQYGTGFPVFGNEGNGDMVSTNRFITIFILDYRRAMNNVYGALLRLKFIRAFRDKNTGEIAIQITRSGREFYNINNHVVDENGWNSSSLTPLSPIEIEFLINHIQETIPMEYKAMVNLLRSIDKGNGNQTKLKISLKKDWKDVVKMIEDYYHRLGRQVDSFKVDGMMHNYMNAILSRCTELGLIIKDKDRLAVTYKLSDSGKNII